MFVSWRPELSGHKVCVPLHYCELAPLTDMECGNGAQYQAEFIPGPDMCAILTDNARHAVPNVVKFWHLSNK